jgi:putative methyltransferase (TIGR04325 family)
MIDLGKPISAYRGFLSRCLPPSLKFRGVYASFEEASANAPKGLLIGYDHEAVANIHEWQADAVLASDYPVLFWLRECLRSGSRIFDFGGNLGVSFYAWQDYLLYPDDFRWMVCDVPAIIERGRKLAVARNERRICFTSSFGDAEGCDVLLTSGCLQLVETPIIRLLGQLKTLPEHLLINRIPLNKSHAAVTLMNLRRLVAPYHVFHRDRFIAEVESLGYKLRDIWTADDHSCWIPFYPEYSVESYSGLYFQR